MKQSQIICVLSGGGAKAAAHVGAVRALMERGVKPVHYVGTSMGAVMAACFAYGLSYSQILKRITSITRSDVASLSPAVLLGPFANNLFRAGPLKDTIAALVGTDTFDSLEVPLTVTAVDSKSGELVLFGAGGRTSVSLVEALYASCALPLYYPPAQIGNRDYVDGGLRAVLPLDVAMRFDPELLFAVEVGPSLHAEPAEKAERLPPMVRAHGQAVGIMMAAQTEQTIERWRNGPVPCVLVRPNRESEVTFAVHHVVRYVELGYREANAALDEWIGDQPDDRTGTRQ